MSTALTTFAGSLEDVHYYFDHPSNWIVEDTAADGQGAGVVSVLGPDGKLMASLTVLTYLEVGSGCEPGKCLDRPAVYLGDWAGQTPMSVFGPFVVRTLAMDLAGFPEDRLRYGWPNNVRVVTSIYSATNPPSNSYFPPGMFGVGRVETGVVAVDGNTDRIVHFDSFRDFGTLGEAQAYSRTEEHSQIQAMIASFREQ